MQMKNNPNVFCFIRPRKSQIDAIREVENNQLTMSFSIVFHLEILPASRNNAPPRREAISAGKRQEFRIKKRNKMIRGGTWQNFLNMF